jgi:hypothetical protein
VRAMKTYTSAAFSLKRNNDFVNKLPYCSIANRVHSFGTLAWINWTTPTVHEVMGCRLANMSLGLTAAA